MGVKGLLPCLKSITRSANLESYRGLTVGVDAMCWLHKGIFTSNVKDLAKFQFDSLEASTSIGLKKDDDCGPEMLVRKRLDFESVLAPTVTKNRKHTLDRAVAGQRHRDAIVAVDNCVGFVIRQATILQEKYGMHVILVIDGMALPSKKAINERRRQDRAAAYTKGLAAEKMSNAKDSRKFFSRACSITPEMRHNLTLKCQQNGISFLIAPYESDAQLARLSHTGMVDLIISEDSDMLVYGCARVLFKLDSKTGKGDEIQIMRDLATNYLPKFRNWNHDMFVYMCILSGCDYCDGVPGVGIQTAHKLVRIHRKPSKIFKSLDAAGKLPLGFEESFWIAYRTFRHQRIYCQTKKRIDPLFPIKESGDREKMWDFLGPWIDEATAQGIANGILHPIRHVPWIDINDQLDEELPFPQKNRRTKEMAVPVNKDDGVVQDDNDKKLFAFFRQIPRGRKGDGQGGNLSDESEEIKSSYKIQSTGKPVQTIAHSISNFEKHIPSHYHDYTSALVGDAFKPLKRNTKRVIKGRGGIRKTLRKLQHHYLTKKAPKQGLDEDILRSTKNAAINDELSSSRQVAPPCDLRIENNEYSSDGILFDYGAVSQDYDIDKNDSVLSHSTPSSSSQVFDSHHLCGKNEQNKQGSFDYEYRKLHYSNSRDCSFQLQSDERVAKANSLTSFGDQLENYVSLMDKQQNSFDYNFVDKNQDRESLDDFTERETCDYTIGDNCHYRRSSYKLQEREEQFIAPSSGSDQLGYGAREDHFFLNEIERFHLL